jgi:hypothetical protein
MRKVGIITISWALVIILAITTFAIAADAQLTPGTSLPSNTGLASPGTFRQGMQTGAIGQGTAGGFAGGFQNLPGGIVTRPQAGTGIAVGEPSPSGGATCYCIRAPCYCPGSSPGGTIPFPSQQFPDQRFPNPPVLSQPFQGQPLSTLPASAGSVNPAFSNAAGPGTITR